MIDSIKNLRKIKSIITITLTLTFVILLIAGLFTDVVIPQEFVMIYTTIVSFYFGTQYQKGVEERNANSQYAETIAKNSQ